VVADPASDSRIEQPLSRLWRADAAGRYARGALPCPGSSTSNG